MSDLTTFNLEVPVPVFPLNGTVLLPYGLLPLHIFEARYRRMVHDALDSTGLIAMGRFENEVTREEYLEGAPALHPFVGLGYLNGYRELEDGRYIIVLQGLVRAAIVKEAEPQEYRRVLLDPLDNIPGDAQQLDQNRERLVELVNRTGLIESEERTIILNRVKEDPMERVVDELAAATIKDPETLEFLLEEVRVTARVERVIDYLETFQAAGPA